MTDSQPENKAENVPASNAAGRLDAPPRPSPRLLPLYLMLLTTQLGWLFFGVGFLSFWIWCAFGADVKTVLFLAPKQTVLGTVTRIEATPFREGEGYGPQNDELSEVSTHPIYAVHYVFAPSTGPKQAGVSYSPGDAETGPSLWMHDPHTHSLRFGDRADVPLAAGMSVPIEMVRGLPSVSRIAQMGSNVFPPYRLIILSFIALGLIWIVPGLRNLRRIRFLLESGVEDAARENLTDPAGHRAPLPLVPPANRWLGIRDRKLHSPSAAAFLLVLLLPILSVVSTGIYICSHLVEIAYTWHSLTGH